MQAETSGVRGEHSGDPTTKAVAVPIYQTVAYEFDSADHVAALFNLEAEGSRYGRSNVTAPQTAFQRPASRASGGNGVNFDVF